VANQQGEGVDQMTNPPDNEHTPTEPAPDDLTIGEATTGEVAAGDAAAEPVVVSRWAQALALAVALLALAWLVKAAAPVVMIFVVAAVVALVINPLVGLLQRGHVPRGAAIAVVFAGFFAVLAGVVALLVRPVAHQVSVFRDNLPQLIDSANTSLAQLQTWLDHRGVGIQLKAPGQTALDTLQDSILRGSGDVVAFTRDLVTTIAETGFVLILTLVITIYMLIYGHQIGTLARHLMPPGNGTIDDDYPTRVQRAVSGYVRGQLVFSLIMGLSAGLALWIFGALGIFPAGRTYAVFFGVFYALMELIPYLGPILGAAPPILVALLQGDPLTALWLVLLFIVLQQLEGHIVAPQVFGHHLRINPLLVMFALLVGGHLHGIPGALVALPIAAVARETVLYLRRHLLLEPWGTLTAAAITAGPPPPAQPRRPAADRPWTRRALTRAHRWSTIRLHRPPSPPPGAVADQQEPAGRGDHAQPPRLPDTVPDKPRARTGADPGPGGAH
jgi:predicted PurR-regulated permease PerM